MVFCGDRCGTVFDPEGYAWMVATHIAEPTPHEMKKFSVSRYKLAGEAPIVFAYLTQQAGVPVHRLVAPGAMWQDTCLSEVRRYWSAKVSQEWTGLKRC